MSNVLYRQIETRDLTTAHQLSQEAKWPHRLEDWQFIHELGVGFVAEKDNEVVGTALCWKYAEDHASLGMVIVSPAHQGAGIGKELMNLLFKELGSRIVFLNATQAGKPLYEKLGFKPTGSFIHQHQGAAFTTPLIPLEPGQRLRPIGQGDIEALTDLSATANGLHRPELFKALLDCAEGIAVDNGKEIEGFAFYRRFGRGYVIGPVVAATQAQAKALISHWVNSNTGIFIRIDINNTTGLSPWLVELGLLQVDTSLSMVKGNMPDLPSSPISVAITNQALG